MVKNNHGSHISGILKQLATPWNIALERAKRVQNKGLSEGFILDLACGSGIQLAAYSYQLNKPCIGIEINKKRAAVAKKTLKKILTKEIYEKSNIIHGDCLEFSKLNIEEGINFSLIHLDPARPTNVQAHIISEMEPSPIEAIKNCKELLSKNGSIILDLSPRLSQKQCEELKIKLDELLPDLEKTWEWSSQGRGRVDRLSVWIGKIATPNKVARYVRNHPRETNKSVIIEGEKLPWELNEEKPQKKEGKINDIISIVDPALISSGLEQSWIKSHGFEGVWIRKDGRRPLYLHSNKPDLKNESKGLIFESGIIRDIIQEDIEENIENIIKIANKLELNKLTLRLKIPPELHPKIQSKINRNLVDIGSSGIIIRLPNNTLAICSKI